MRMKATIASSSPSLRKDLTRRCSSMASARPPPVHAPHPAAARPCPAPGHRPSMPSARPPPGHAQHPAVPELLSLLVDSIEEDATVATERARGRHARGDVEGRRADDGEYTRRALGTRKDYSPVNTIKKRWMGWSGRFCPIS
jgi:hypothetical protein